MLSWVQKSFKNLSRSQPDIFRLESLPAGVMSEEGRLPGQRFRFLLENVLERLLRAVRHALGPGLLEELLHRRQGKQSFWHKGYLSWEVFKACPLDLASEREEPILPPLLSRKLRQLMLHCLEIRIFFLIIAERFRMVHRPSKGSVELVLLVQHFMIHHIIQQLLGGLAEDAAHQDRVCSIFVMPQFSEGISAPHEVGPFQRSEEELLVHPVEARLQKRIILCLRDGDVHFLEEKMV